MKYKSPKIICKKIKTSSFFTRKSRYENVFGENLLAICIYGAIGTCILPKTKIIMSDKSIKNIEQIVTGDRVLSYNLRLGHLIEGVVSKKYIHSCEKSHYFVINESLKITGEHPVWANDTWVTVSSLNIGDRLLNEKGEKILIKNITQEQEQNFQVFNLKLYGATNNYFCENILVHSLL